MRRDFVVLTALACSGAPAIAASPAVTLPAGVNPPDIRVTTFASRLNVPTGMQPLSDGSIRVATSNSPTGTGSFYASSTGSLLRFTDANHDGVADGAPLNLAPTDQPLGGAITSIRRAGDLLFVNHAVEPNSYRISVLRAGAGGPTSKYTTLGQVTLAYPTAAWTHQTYALAVRP